MNQIDPKRTRKASTPRFEHDPCPGCVFLGRQGDEDVYYCNQGGSLSTVIFRWGDDGPEYRSGWHLQMEVTGPRRTALEKAVEGPASSYVNPDSPFGI